MWDFIVLFEVFHAFLNSWQAFCINLLLRCMEKWYTSILISATFKVLALDIHFFFEVQWHNGIFSRFYTPVVIFKWVITSVNNSEER